MYLNVGFIVFLLWNVLDFKIFFNLVFFYVLFYNVIYIENVELDNDNYIYIVYVLYMVDCGYFISEYWFIEFNFFFWIYWFNRYM